MTESDFANKNSSIHHDIHHSPSGDEHTDEGDPHPTHSTHQDHSQHHETEATRNKEKAMKTTNLKKVAGLVLTAGTILFFANSPIKAFAFATPGPSCAQSPVPFIVQTPKDDPQPFVGQTPKDDPQPFVGPTPKDDPQPFADQIG